MACPILHVNDVSAIGGAENSLLQLLRGLDRREFEPIVALPRRGPLSEEMGRLGVPVFFAPMTRLRHTRDPGRLACQAACTLAAASSIAREARRRRVALIHAHKTSALPAAGLAARLVGVPCVWHMRDLRRLSWPERRVGRLAEAAIAVSRAVLKESGIGPGDPEATVISNGIDADEFAARARPGEFRRELGLGPSEPLVLVVAQMAPWKGHGDFLKAFAAVRRSHPTAVAALAGDDLFGDHPTYVGELRRLAAVLHLGGAVHFLGYRTDVQTLMADADLLVIPSKAEPFGRVALEAMAVGRPVVGRRFGGLPEVVEDGVTGRLTAGLSPEELADAISALLAEPGVRAEMGAAGRRRVRERFSLGQHADEVSALYRRLLRRRT